MNKADTLRVPDYLDHILQAIQRIRRYTAPLTEASFLDNELVQDDVIRNIERHHPAFAAGHAEVPWSDIYLMRNRVSHGYFTVDLEIIWKTIQNDLPALEQQVLKLRQEIFP